VNKFLIVSNYFQLAPVSWGTIDRAVHRSHDSVFLTAFDGAPCPDFLHTEINSFWDDSNIYFFFKGSFDNLTIAPVDTKQQVPCGKTMDLWDLSDVYEVFLGPDAKTTGLYKEFQIAPDNRWLDVAINNSDSLRRSDFQWHSGLKAMTRILKDEKKWLSLFIIPYLAFQLQSRTPNAWHVNFYRINNNRQESQKHYLAWAPVHHINFHQHQKFGEIVFIK
jgi:hypothetical protein